MIKGKSGSIAVKVTSYIQGNATVVLYWEEWYDVLRNVSVIHVTKITVQHDRFSGEIYVNLTFYIDGREAVKLSGNQHKGNSPGVDSPGDVSGNYPYASFEIPHDAITGKKSVEFKVIVDNCFSNVAGWQGDSNKFSVSDVSLTTIPRATTVAATDANVGSVSMLAVNRKSTAYTHSIQYQFGSLSGYIMADGSVSAYEEKLTATNIGFTVPDSFYSQMGSDTAKTCVLYTKTYNGYSQIGDTQESKFTVRVPESENAPYIEGYVYDSNQTTTALTGNSNTLVRFFSTAQCTIYATPKNGASIVTTSINGQDASSGSVAFPNVENGDFLFAAEDTRGYKSSTTVTKYVVPYIKLTNNATVERDDPTSGNATLKLSGECFSGNFGNYTNMVSARYKIDNGNYVMARPQLSGDSYSATIALTGLDYRTAHTIDVEIGDALMRVTKQLTVRKGIPLFTVDENDLALNIGLYVEGRHIHPDADRVTHTDRQGNWTYRKWATHYAEVWGTFDLGTNIKCENPWGTLYETDPFGSYDYPFPFVEVPKQFIAIGNCYDGVILEQVRPNTKQNTGTFCLARPTKPTSGTIGSASVFYYAFGKYK